MPVDRKRVFNLFVYSFKLTRKKLVDCEGAIRTRVTIGNYVKVHLKQTLRLVYMPMCI